VAISPSPKLFHSLPTVSCDEQPLLRISEVKKLAKMREDTSESFSTAPKAAVQAQANAKSLLRNILPASPSESRFYAGDSGILAL
jgi:uncharacterized membrane-anchored protein